MWTSTQPGVTSRPSASISRLRRPGLAADRGDPLAVDRDVAGEGRRAGAVDDRAAANDDVVHLGFSR